MKKYNLVFVYNKSEDKILMCKREKEPFKGKFNLVGGKVNEKEDELIAAYRELEEETNISEKYITLTHIMNLQYELSDFELEVYVGKLSKEVDLKEEINKLYWIDKNEDFTDTNKFAGYGNLAHIYSYIELNKNKIFNL